MLLSEVLNIININQTFNLKRNIRFEKITRYSKLTNRNTLFVINSKKNFNIKFLKEAEKNQSPAIISDKYYKEFKFTQLIVKDLEKESDKILSYLFPQKPLNSIAVTGTNGKTSVVSYISQFCNKNKINSKTLGTLGYYINCKKKEDTFLTTPEYEELYQYGFNKKKQNYNFVFEASSHSLAQNRIKNFPVDIAAITNISTDHLDYHRNIINYKNSKFKLFNLYLNSNGIAVLNSRLRNFKSLYNIIKKRKIKIITYGSKDIYFETIRDKMFINIFKKKYKIRNLNLTNIEKENLECAIACCTQINIKNNNIIRNLNKIKNPPGRLQLINLKKMKAKIIIDYAHTPDALLNILKSYSDKKKPSLLFGCGGERDKQKRKLMGIIAQKYADKVYITDDNPRNEDPSKIRKEILKYCTKGIEINSRKKAIITALENIDLNEVLIIAGKGHEKFQLIKNKKIAFNDMKFLKKII